jgi:KTSC domain
MKRTPLQSRAVLSAGYDANAQELELEFKNGRVYRYRGVPAGVFAFLLRTPSKGGFVNRMIQNRYPFEDITPSAGAQDVLEALEASLVSAPDSSSDPVS